MAYQKNQGGNSDKTIDDHLLNAFVMPLTISTQNSKAGIVIPNFCRRKLNLRMIEWLAKGYTYVRFLCSFCLAIWKASEERAKLLAENKLGNILSKTHVKFAKSFWKISNSEILANCFSEMTDVHKYSNILFMKCSNRWQLCLTNLKSSTKSSIMMQKI